MRASLVVTMLLALAGTAAAAPTPEERCAAYQLAATGARISAKLHCRAWAKLAGNPVDQACLDKAEKRFLLHLIEGGPGCVAPDDAVSLGAAADEQANAVVADVEPDAPQIVDVSGSWRTRTSVALDQNVRWMGCELDQLRPCPFPEQFMIIECRTVLEQDASTLHYVSDCATAADSPQPLPVGFTQEATGSVDPVTGEWMLAGTVRVPVLLDEIAYQAEGVFSPDGRSMTGFSTAGWSSGPASALWLASTTGERID